MRAAYRREHVRPVARFSGGVRGESYSGACGCESYFCPDAGGGVAHGSVPSAAAASCSAVNDCGQLSRTSGARSGRCRGRRADPSSVRRVPQAQVRSRNTF
jgi:hypothetical protein